MGRCYGDSTTGLVNTSSGNLISALDAQGEGIVMDLIALYRIKAHSRAETEIQNVNIAC